MAFSASHFKTTLNTYCVISKFSRVGKSLSQAVFILIQLNSPLPGHLYLYTLLELRLRRLLKTSLCHPVGNVDRYNPSGKEQAALGRIHGTDKQKDRHRDIGTYGLDWRKGQMSEKSMPHKKSNIHTWSPWPGMVRKKWL